MKRVYSVGFAAVFLFTTVQMASAQTEMTGIRAMGMGGAFTASATGSGALTHNAAGISIIPMYSVEGSYSHDVETGIHNLHTSIVDGKSNQTLGGGFGYTYSRSSNEAAIPGFRGHDIYGALSLNAYPGWIMVGATIHYIKHELADITVSGTTLDAGMMARLGDYVNFGVNVRNLIEIEEYNRPVTTSIGIGAHAYNFQVTFDTDLVLESDIEVGYRVGGEVLFLEMLPLRAGFHRASSGQQDLSFGTGFRSEAMGGDLLFRQGLDDRDRRIFGLALNIYL
jgi:hypothetical protein